jgi:beta-aspartyl-peptidase (threonine type)
MTTMRRTVGRIGGVVLAVCLVVPFAFLVLDGQAGPSETSAAAQKAIRQVLDDQVAAWNKGDLDGFMKGYWKSPKLTFFSGKDRTQGWQATLERYRKKYQTGDAKMGQLTFRDLEIEVLSPTTAWARGRWQVVRGKETLGGLFTLVFKKQPEGWRIVHDHTSAG